MRLTTLYCVDCRKETDFVTMTEVNDYWYCRDCLPNAPKPVRGRKK